MRGGSNYKKQPLPTDDQYQSVMVAKFINYLMLAGKKSLARRITHQALANLEKQTKQPALNVFETAIKNVSPLLEVRSRRIGGANYQVPMEVRPERKQALAMKWIIQAARTQKGRPMAVRLTDELMNAFNGTGTAIKKREDLHKMAESNRAFAHFARF